MIRQPLRQLLKRCVPPVVARYRLADRSQVLLTFDDGPDPEWTPRVLDVLDRFGARGLFFVPGLRVSRAPHLLREIVARGHGLGNHGYAHRHFPAMSWSALIADLIDGRRAIFDETGVQVRFVRPPYGAVDLRVPLAAWRTGHRIMLWSANTREYEVYRTASPSVIADALLAQPLAGTIVLSHDDHPAIADATAQVLPALLAARLDPSGALATMPWHHGDSLPVDRLAAREEARADQQRLSG